MINKKQLFLVAFACIVCVACSKSVPEDSKTENIEPVPVAAETAFVKGQKVTLSGSSSEVSKVSGALNGDRVDFVWEEDDKILVKVNDKTAEFTLCSTLGSNFGKFFRNDACRRQILYGYL